MSDPNANHSNDDATGGDMDTEDTNGFVVQPLFGGAMSVVLPKGCDDVSRLRQIPDNQEAFVQVSTDRSIIIELLTHDATVANADSAQHYFNDLASANSATQAIVTSAGEVEAANAPALDRVAYRGYVCGRQMVSKFKESATNEINVFLAVFRLPEINTDILVTQCVPVRINDESSSAQSASTFLDEEKAASDFAGVLGTLECSDWSLFV